MLALITYFDAGHVLESSLFSLLIKVVKYHSTQQRHRRSSLSDARARALVALTARDMLLMMKIRPTARELAAFPASARLFRLFGMR